MQSDGILTDRWIKTRDAEAFAELVSRYASMVYATCRRVLRDATSAEDVAQECFEALAQADHVPADYLGPWLHRVAVRRSLNQLRGNQRRHRRESQFAEDQAVSSEPHWDDLYDLVDEAIASLDETYRVALVAHFLQGKTHAAIAEDLQVSRQTVSKRIAQGVDSIRDALRRKGVPVGAAALVAMLEANAVESAPGQLICTLGKIGVAGVATATAGSSLSAFSTAIIVFAAATAITVGAVTWTFNGAGTMGVHGEVASAPPAIDRPANLEAMTESMEEDFAASQEAALAKVSSYAADIEIKYWQPAGEPLAGHVTTKTGRIWRNGNRLFFKGMVQGQITQVLSETPPDLQSENELKVDQSPTPQQLVINDEYLVQSTEHGTSRMTSLIFREDYEQSKVFPEEPFLDAYMYYVGFEPVSKMGSMASISTRATFANSRRFHSTWYLGGGEDKQYLERRDSSGHANLQIELGPTSHPYFMRSAFSPPKENSSFVRYDDCTYQEVDGQSFPASYSQTTVYASGRVEKSHEVKISNVDLNPDLSTISFTVADLNLPDRTPVIRRPKDQDEFYYRIVNGELVRDPTVTIGEIRSGAPKPLGEE